MKLHSDACSRADARIPGGLQCQLKFRPPLAWSCLLGYLRLRAIPGVEMADETHYRRTVDIEDHRGWIAVSLNPTAKTLTMDLSPSLAPVIDTVIVRTKQLFDLGAVPHAVSELLAQDPLLEGTVRRLPGLRVAGAFDGFELAVRAILGQQVSVKAATTVAGRWAHRFGAPIATPFPALNRLTPSMHRMAAVTAEEICVLGVVGARARCLIQLANAAVERRVALSFAANVEEQIENLMRIAGIGPWTAQYIAMRALHWPDAFPTGDLMLMKAANLSYGQLQQRAQAWRPWRAYAAHYLWQSLGVHP
jgi:AraC family transcriptional regulator, regulatory protein of adaptative response / DNA-3-methyladenine glycosylase II